MQRLVLAVVFLSAVAAVAQKPSTSVEKHFDSGLGFSYDVPAGLHVADNKPFDISARRLALQQSTTAQEVKSVNCAQPLLIAENRDESRIVEFVATPQGCATGIVTEKNLDQLGRYGTKELAKRFAFVKPEFTQFKVGSHAFWTMRSEMTPNPPNNPNTQMAVVVTFTPDAIVQVMVMARTPADMAALGATRIKFDDGSDVALVPDMATVAR